MRRQSPRVCDVGEIAEKYIEGTPQVSNLPVLPDEGGPDGENYGGVLRMLDVLLGSDTSAAEKRKILQDDYDIQIPWKGRCRSCAI